MAQRWNNEVRLINKVFPRDLPLAKIVAELSHSANRQLRKRLVTDTLVKIAERMACGGVLLGVPLRIRADVVADIRPLPQSTA